MSENKEEAVVREGGELITKGAFGITIEQAREQIGHTLAMYKLVNEVANKLLTNEDIYYMSTINNPKAEPKENEPRVLTKGAVDKLLGFFRIKVFPTTKKIDGGYEVTIVGEDQNGNYIASGGGVCTKYEKKYSWIKADDEEYAAAAEVDRREVKRKGQHGSYKVKQIKTDERAIAHTLISMAEKRARAAFCRKAFPGLNDVRLEGEGEESDYQYTKDEQTESNTLMSESEIADFYTRLKDDHGAESIKKGMKEVLKRAKFGKLTRDEAEVLEKYLNAQKGQEND